ncbi:putative tetratricopeptide-like helical domain-containing protein [Medicago truncatula]|uniref:Putative tetratricopeptide-like helical domain-containing protein n=1 Tax=Medicago truncatula TaxID=3880 RepID=A0A396H568_MEDTR|nr:pentatricopeptide repeat-containing protein At3g53360, mitochondrial [Medicago truncatula]RHN48436.1 putative tetratricopeptide-like helical domain-containing protein [Medicago truncatula]
MTIHSVFRRMYSYVKPSLQPAIFSNLSKELPTNSYIIFLCKQHHYKEALEAFDFHLKNSNSHFEPSTYTSLVLACANFRSLDYAKKIHDHVLKSNYQPSIILQNHMINMYGKCGSMKDARKVFDTMQLPNVVSWTSMISGYSQNGQANDAIIMYIQMTRSGQFPDQLTFGSVIKACYIAGDIDLGRQLHAHVIKSWFGHHLTSQNALISMYTNFGQIEHASNVFTRIPTKDLISWGTMITGYIQLGYRVEALYLFRDLLRQGTYQPNEFIFGSVFSACSSLLELEYGKQVHGMCVKFGLRRNVFAGCSLCDMYAKFGFLPSAKMAFCQIKNPDIVSWNAIIAAFADNGDANEAIDFFRQMIHIGLTPDSITYISLLCTCGSPVRLNQGRQIHSYIVKIGFDKEITVCNSLLTMYTKCSHLHDALNVFRDISRNANLVSWNAILSACLQKKQEGETFRLYKEMHFSGNKPDSITITTLLGTCAELTSLGVGNQVHCYSIKSGLILDVSVCNGLIDMYAKCGSLKHARDVFDSTQNLDIVSWSSLIVGYAQCGLGHEALNLFRIMTNLGVQPNEVTYLGALSACSHIGLVEEGWRLYKSMETEHGIPPTREHFSCIVDLLARAGCLHEAETFIQKSGLDADITAWKTLLAACKTHNNVDIAERGAGNILKLDPSNSAAMVMLCNIHASAGNWEEVAKLRKLMKQMGVQKVPGQSWIEVKDKFHIFFSEDSSHPQRNLIYTMLEELWSQVLDDGYDPCQRLDVSIW